MPTRSPPSALISAEQVREVIRAVMPASMYRRPGAVLYCGTDALRPGRAYLMGLNPGDDPEKTSRSIIDSIPNRIGFSEYTHECWDCDQGEDWCKHLDQDHRVLHSALLKHQRNVIDIASALGVGPEALFSANAVFGRSTRLETLHAQTGYALDAWWSACWEVHKRFIAVVRPRVIVSLGYGLHTSPLGLLRRQFPDAPLQTIVEETSVGGRSFTADMDLPTGRLSVRVLGIPHPSWRRIGPRAEAELRSYASIGAQDDVVNNQ